MLIARFRVGPDGAEAANFVGDVIGVPLTDPSIPEGHALVQPRGAALTARICRRVDGPAQLEGDTYCEVSP